MSEGRVGIGSTHVTCCQWFDETISHFHRPVYFMSHSDDWRLTFFLVIDTRTSTVPHAPSCTSPLLLSFERYFLWLTQRCNHASWTQAQAIH